MAQLDRLMVKPAATKAQARAFEFPTLKNVWSAEITIHSRETLDNEGQTYTHTHIYSWAPPGTGTCRERVVETTVEKTGYTNGKNLKENMKDN